MIYLQTGLPGAGKTLYTITMVKELAEKEKRPVFYSGIKDITLDWTEFEAEKWMDCPDGSIIVIDECQRIFRPRGNGSKVPDYVKELETHRHRGIDIYLITQHPMLMDSNVRRLTERHSHISRRFGMQRATVFQYESCKDQPLANTATAQRLDWRFPKTSFDLYKSAEVHTVKRRLPMQYALMFLVPLLVIGLVWFFIQRHYQDGEIVINPDQPKPVESIAPGLVSHSPPKLEKPKALTTEEYIAAYAPRLPGLAYTAPVYDEVTKPQEAPVPVACVSSKSRGCKCYSQQATRLDMAENTCLQIVKNGFFQAFGQKDVVMPQSESVKPVAVSAASPLGALMHQEPVKPVELASVGNDSTNPRFNQSLRGNP